MRRALLLAAATACSSSPSAPNQVSTFVWGTPTLIAYRDGTGNWQTPKRDAGGNYQLAVTDDYQLVVVCSDLTGFTTKLRQRTASDGSDDFVWCMNHGDPFSTVEVTGSMVQPGFVSLYDYASSATGPWQFTLQVTPGPHDLGATADGRLLVQRGIDISSGVTLDALDVDAQGTPLVLTDLSFTGLEQGDQVTSEADIYAANDIITAPATGGAAALLPPQAVLQSGEQLDLYVTAWSANHVRTADRWFTGSETSFVLPPVMDGVKFSASDTVHATWSALPAHDELAVQLEAIGTGYQNIQEVTASQSWLDLHGASEVAFELDKAPPRFQEAWTLDLSMPYTRSFIARSNGDTVTTTAYREAANAPRLQAPAAGSSRTHLHWSNRSPGR